MDWFKNNVRKWVLGLALAAVAVSGSLLLTSNTPTQPPALGNNPNNVAWVYHYHYWYHPYWHYWHHPYYYNYYYWNYPYYYNYYQPYYYYDDGGYIYYYRH